MNQKLMEECIYTIAHGDRLEEAFRAGGPARFRESSRWVSGARLLTEAQLSNRVLPLLFADAASASALLCWGEVVEIALDEGGTDYVVANLRRIQGTHMPHELTLLRSGAKISANDIRPYRLCRTPSFLLGTPGARMSKP